MAASGRLHVFLVWIGIAQFRYRYDTILTHHYRLP